MKIEDLKPGQFIAIESCPGGVYMSPDGKISGNSIKALYEDLYFTCSLEVDEEEGDEPLGEITVLNNDSLEAIQLKACIEKDKYVSLEDAALDYARKHYPVGTKFSPAHTDDTYDKENQCIITSDGQFHLEYGVICNSINGDCWTSLENPKYGNTTKNRNVFYKGIWAKKEPANEERAQSIRKHPIIKKGMYIVILDDAKGLIPGRHVYRQKKDNSRVCPELDIIEGNNNERISVKPWRYATEEEIKHYDAIGKPYDVTMPRAVVDSVLGKFTVGKWYSNPKNRHMDYGRVSKAEVKGSSHRYNTIHFDSIVKDGVQSDYKGTQSNLNFDREMREIDFDDIPIKSNNGQEELIVGKWYYYNKYYIKFLKVERGLVISSESIDDKGYHIFKEEPYGPLEMNKGQYESANMRGVEILLPSGHPEKKTITLRELKDGETYFFDYVTGKYINKITDKSRHLCTSIEVCGDEEIPKLNTGSMYGTAHIRVATKEEKHWMNLCIKKNKGISLSEARLEDKKDLELALEKEEGKKEYEFPGRIELRISNNSNTTVKTKKRSVPISVSKSLELKIEVRTPKKSTELLTNKRTTSLKIRGKNN